MVLGCFVLPFAVAWVLSTWIVRNVMFFFVIMALGAWAVDGLRQLWFRFHPREDERVVVMTPSGRAYLVAKKK
jgi:hypothetical protein